MAKGIFTPVPKTICNIRDNMSDAFSANAVYAVGDVCIHNNVLYKCITAVETAGEWDESFWEAITIASLFNQFSNVRYNPTTDMVEIFTNGVWMEWKVANIILTILVENSTFVDEDIKYALTYATQQLNCFIGLSGTLIKTSAWVNTNNNYNVAGWTNITKEFTATGGTVNISVKNYSYLGGSNSYGAKLYIKNVSTGVRTLLGSIFSSGTYKFTLPNDAVEYTFDVYTWVNGYGWTSAGQGEVGAEYFTLTITELNIE